MVQRYLATFKAWKRRWETKGVYWFKAIKFKNGKEQLCEFGFGQEREQI